MPMIVSRGARVRVGRLAPAWLGMALLAGCSDGPPPAPQNFPAVHYDYLTPLRLNVAAIDVEDQSTPPDGDLSSRSPVRPADAMQQMAHDRLIAAGGSGTATFVVTDASITRTDTGVTEHLAARLEISNGAGGHAGFAEAHVTRTETPGNGAPAGPASLYELTRAAMEDMNVEFEYQVRHTLRDWLITDGAVEAPVEQAPLSGSAPAAGAPLPLAPAGTPVPPAPATPDLTPGAPMALVAPPSPAAAASPGAMSPPPGYLSVPGAPPAPLPEPGDPPPYGAQPYNPQPYGNVPPSSQAYPAGGAGSPTGY